MNNSLSAKLSPKKLLPLPAVALVILFLSGCGSSRSTLSSPSPNLTGNASSPATTGGTNTASSSGLPTPPAGATVFSNIDDSTDSWADCSDCAGGTVTTDYWTAPSQAIPSLDGSSREFYVGGPAWADVLWYKRFGPYDQVPNYPYNSATHFLWDFYVYFDTASAANVWSAEYDAFQSVNGQKFMMGSECVFGENVWHVSDGRGHVNIPGVPCPRFTPNTWHHIVWYTERISANQYRFNTLVVDEKSYTVNMTFDSIPTDWGDVVGVQWQLDVDSQGNPVHEWVDKATFTIW